MPLLPGLFCGLRGPSCAQFVDGLRVGGPFGRWRAARELVAARPSAAKRAGADAHARRRGHHDSPSSTDTGRGHGEGSHRGQELPRLPDGIPPGKPVLRERRRGADRWAPLGAVLARHDLPHVSQGVLARCQLLSRGLGRAGTVRFVRCGELHAASSKAGFAENLPRMRRTTDLGPHLLRPGWDRAGRRQLSATERSGAIRGRKPPKDRQGCGSKGRGDDA